MPGSILARFFGGSLPKAVLGRVDYMKKEGTGKKI